MTGKRTARGTYNWRLTLRIAGQYEPNVAISYCPWCGDELLPLRSDELLPLRSAPRRARGLLATDLGPEEPSDEAREDLGMAAEYMRTREDQEDDDHEASHDDRQEELFR